jgi:hypothetical protein
MATLYVTEFSKPATVSNGVVQVAQMPPIAQQTAVIGTVVSTSAFNAATVLIRVHADAICSIAIGTSPTATTAMTRLAANQTEYFGVSPGDKLSVITNT